MVVIGDVVALRGRCLTGSGLRASLDDDQLQLVFRLVNLFAGFTQRQVLHGCVVQLQPRKHNNHATKTQQQGKKKLDAKVKKRRKWLQTLRIVSPALRDPSSAARPDLRNSRT